MEDPGATERHQRNRERLVTAFSVWAEDICDRLETDDRFFQAVEAAWLSGLVVTRPPRVRDPGGQMDDLLSGDAAIWQAVPSVLTTLRAELEQGGV
jgi:hypothetical protein